MCVCVEGGVRKEGTRINCIIENFHTGMENSLKCFRCQDTHAHRDTDRVTEPKIGSLANSITARPVPTMRL